MTKSKLAIVILAAGIGSRMKSKKSKVLHPLAGQPMINHLVKTINSLEPDAICVVVGEQKNDVAKEVYPLPTVIQSERLGTAHAVLVARENLSDFDGDVLVLYGDTPLIKFDTFHALLDARASAVDPAVVVLGFTPEDPNSYGRLIINKKGNLESIVETEDASNEQLKINFCNSGVMLIDGNVIWDLLERVDNKNTKGEYYLTDIIGLAREHSRECIAIRGDCDELIGINSREDLAEAESILQDRLRSEALKNGVTFLDPKSVYLSYDTQFGQDVTIAPNVFFGKGVKIGDGAKINAFCHIEGATISAESTVGPFARLRSGSEVGYGVKVGNFVEIKNSTIEKGAKVPHLSYVGDAHVGSDANIGAGTITCNYNGFSKAKTVIGNCSFIGSNTALVAPVSIGDGAVIGAGSTITKNVSSDSLAVTRASQREIVGWAKKNRDENVSQKVKK